MTADELKTLTTTTLDALGAALDADHSETLTAFFRAMARFHRYSFHNICLIVAQRPTATQVAGFQTWKSLGRFVRRGEKGIAICAPIIRRRREVTDDDERRIAGFRAAYVFDIAQTDGEGLPEVSQVVGEPVQALARLRDGSARALNRRSTPASSSRASILSARQSLKRPCESLGADICRESGPARHGEAGARTEHLSPTSRPASFRAYRYISSVYGSAPPSVDRRSQTRTGCQWERQDRAFAEA